MIGRLLMRIDVAHCGLFSQLFQHLLPLFQHFVCVSLMAGSFSIDSVECGEVPRVDPVVVSDCFRQHLYRLCTFQKLTCLQPISMPLLLQ